MKGWGGFITGNLTGFKRLIIKIVFKGIFVI